VHPKFQTPHISTLITGVAASLCAGLVPLGVLGELVSIGTLIAFIVVCIGVLVLRYTRPDLPRPFRIRGVWAVSLLGVIFCSAMAYSLPNETWWRLLVWSALGILVYVFYGFRHSKLRDSSRDTGRRSVELETERG
jgi:APA family basic amino acid/polyamine antiporter